MQYQRFGNPHAMQHMDSFGSADSTISSNNLQCMGNRPVISHMDSFRSVDSTDSANDTVDKLFPSKGSIGGKKAKWKRRTGGKPKRPLSAYNIFFKKERAKLLQEQKKVGFAKMAKEISAKWKNVTDEEHKKYAAEAEVEQKKYRAAVKEWKAQSKLDVQSYTTPLVPLLSNTDPLIIQRLLIQQKMIEQQRLMQEQMQNAIRFSRRMSMPPMGYTSTSGISIGTSQHDENDQSIHRPARRFSMPSTMSKDMSPLAQTNLNLSTDVPCQKLNIHEGGAGALSEDQNTHDSTDDSSLGDGMADFLIKMPLFDDVEEKKHNFQSEFPSIEPVLSSCNSELLDDVQKEKESSTENRPMEVLSNIVDETEPLDSMEDMEDLLGMCIKL